MADGDAEIILFKTITTQRDSSHVRAPPDLAAVAVCSVFMRAGISALSGAGFPIALTFAVSPGWLMPLLALGLFIVLGLPSNNILEP